MEIKKWRKIDSMIAELFLIGNIICAIGTILQITSVIKNKNILTGYNFIGSLLTFLSVLIFQLGFFAMEQYYSVLLGTITLIYWFLVTLYVGIKNANK